MPDFQWSDPYQVMVVTTEISGAHPRFPDYPLLPEDALQLYTDGTWTKVNPGMMVKGFVLSNEHVQTLKPMWMRSANLAYYVVGEVAPEDVDPSLTRMTEGAGYDL